MDNTVPAESEGSDGPERFMGLGIGEGHSPEIIVK